MSTEPIRLIMQQYGVDFGTAVKIYEGMSVADATAEGRDTEVDRKFWLWVEGKYTPRQIEIIKSEDYDFTSIWEHYVIRIAGTQFDVEVENLQSRLQARIDTGEITRAQAADLWN